MKKDKEWLNKKFDEVIEFRKESNPSSSWGMGSNTVLKYIKEDFKNLIDQLDQPDEPEVTLDKAFEKIAESYLMTKEEIWRHLEQLETHDGKVTYGEQEVLSQEWIERNTSPVDDEGRLYIWKRDLQNLIVPKQDIPVIPQFVADYIEEERVKIIDWHTKIPERFFLILGHKLHYTDLASTNISDWVFDGNEEKLYQALKYGYEVEKEKKYTVDLPHSYELIKLLHTQTYHIKEYSESGFGDYTNIFTEKEIKDYDKRFWAFAEEATE